MTDVKRRLGLLYVYFSDDLAPFRIAALRHDIKRRGTLGLIYAQ